ncbi:neurofilament heavy polypeptide-like isoform X10 [Ostrinia furnacalis]|uniref:neurofilament heavy polypeptide-like isoform X10 n=1 Tax=Ostrinia furnacalis TaxID=93504 RepID=UPI00103FB1A9|nr:neurofilament heavy polypeptide-like isoform X10 [Ostrinia furnacalis]
MDSEDSRDGSGEAQSSSSSSSSSSRSRRSSSSDRSESSKKGPKSPPKSPPSPRSNGPRSPSPESRSPSPSMRSTSKPPQSPGNLSGAHSDINSPENSMPASPPAPKSPDAPKSPSDVGSNIGSPERPHDYTSPPPTGGGPKSPRSPASSAPGSPVNTSRPVSPDSVSQPTQPLRKREPRTPSSSPSPDRSSVRSSPRRSPVANKNAWSPKDKWRRHTKAEQKMVSMPRARSRSESSQSSRSSSYNKRANTKDPATEEISDGEMESDQDDRKSQSKSVASEKNEGKDLNISHEDLSDVSDLDSVGPDDSEKEPKRKLPQSSPERKSDSRNINGNANNKTSTQSSPKSDSGSVKLDHPKLEKVPQEKTSNTEDGEEQLDFEAEEGECIEPKQNEQPNGDASAKGSEREEIKAGRRSRGSSLEEGEVSDEAERRPEESEPRPVCRFFSRGACTWGVSCRFLHPGVTDKGNYNMFDVVRGVPASGPYPAAPPRDVAPPESAWERGLRTAKEMLRIANKRKEQDMDFEEKKLHLSVGGVVHDPDAELAYAAAAVGASPPRAHDATHRDPDVYSRAYGAPPMYRGRYPRPADERERYYEHERGYERERAYERPPHYDERAQMQDPNAYHKRRLRSSREVIVQRAEVERREGREPRDTREGREGRDGRGREGRGDEWADPWMRQEPAARRRRPPSSDDSYSSTRLSPSVIVRERRMASARATFLSSIKNRVHNETIFLSVYRLSPSVIVRERRMASARTTFLSSIKYSLAFAQTLSSIK